MSSIFAIFFAWVSFFPQPIQGQYRVWLRIALGIFLLFLMLKRRSRQRLFAISDWPCWLFVITLLAGLMQAKDKNLSLWTFLYFALTFLLLFYLGKGLFQDEKIRDNLALIIAFSACIVSLIGILELSFAKNIIYEYFIENPFYLRYRGEHQRLISTQFNPAVLGSFLVGCLPFSFYLCAGQRFYLRLFGILTTLLAITVIILTFSRGVFLALIVLSLFYLWKKAKAKIAILLAFLLALFILFASWQKGPSLSRFGYQRLICGSYDSIFSEYRLNRLKAAWKILQAHPFFGIGYQHFRIRYAEFCVGADCQKEIYEFRIPDNMYLAFLAETGIIGTFGFLALIGFLLKKGFYQLRERKGNEREISLIVLAALIGLLINMGSYDLFYWDNPYMLFSLCCGFLLR